MRSYIAFYVLLSDTLCDHFKRKGYQKLNPKTEVIHVAVLGGISHYTVSHVNFMDAVKPKMSQEEYQVVLLARELGCTWEEALSSLGDNYVLHVEYS